MPKMIMEAEQEVQEVKRFHRTWGMPSVDTFQCKPIGQFVRRHLRGVSVDPYARNTKLATYRNDLNPNTCAEYHMEAVEFVQMLVDKEVKADTIIFDPPYSPTQLKRSYDDIGRKMTKEDSLGGVTRAKLRKLVGKLLNPDGVVLSFGWNSVGMGKTYGFEIVELMLVCHGQDHNDTICIAERKRVLQELVPLSG